MIIKNILYKYITMMAKLVTEKSVNNTGNAYKKFIFKGIKEPLEATIKIR
jgi:hypothetical protein